MNIFAGLSVVQRYVSIGLAIALGTSMLANAIVTKLWLGARDDVAAAISSCNADKQEIIADAEKMVRIAERAAADRRVAAIQEELKREVAATAGERQARLQAEMRADTRDQELQDLAEGAFDEDELPDSNACLNAFVTSRALRCVLHSRNQGEVGAGPGAGDDSLCSNPEGVDGMHPGFSNVTFLEGLLYWGGDRDAAIRLNGRLAAIEELQDSIVQADQ